MRTYGTVDSGGEILTTETSGRLGGSLLMPRIALAVLIATITVLLQPFQFDINNNAFHIPIVLRWYDLPRYADDPFIQSLRQFASPVYPIVSWFATPSTIEGIFFGLWFASRALTCFALMSLAETLGLVGIWRQ